MTDPQTEAGRRLLAGLTDDDPEARTLLSDIGPAIAAIEREAVAQGAIRAADEALTNVRREAVTAALERLRAVVVRLDTDRDRELMRLAIDEEAKP